MRGFVDRYCMYMYAVWRTWMGDVCSKRGGRWLEVRDLFEGIDRPGG